MRGVKKEQGVVIKVKKKCVCVCVCVEKLRIRIGQDVSSQRRAVVEESD